MISFPAVRPRLTLVGIAAALVVPALLCGCSKKVDSGVGADGKPHFTKGPGIPADVLARANAYRQQHQGQPAK